MQIVVNIPNSLYANLQKIQNGSIAAKRLLQCVREGKKLPAKHGRLIDADKLKKQEIVVYICISDKPASCVRVSAIDNMKTLVKSTDDE